MYVLGDDKLIILTFYSNLFTLMSVVDLGHSILAIVLELE
jgi:hypothetical protein